MWKSRLIWHFPCGIKQASSTKFLQNVRWTTAASVSFDEVALASAKPYEEVPSSLCLPLIGTAWVHLPIIGRHDPKRLHLSFKEKRELLGDVYREKFGPLKIIVSFNPDDLRVMFENDGLYPVRTHLESLKKYRESRRNWYTNLGLIVTNGKEWWDLRTKVQKHLMKPKAIQAFLVPMQDVAMDLIQKIIEERDANSEVPDFLDELYKWGLESVGLVGLDTRLGCLEKNLSPDSDGRRIITCVQTAFDSMNKMEAFTGNLGIWKIFPTKTYKKFEKSFDIFTEIAFRHINQSLEKLKNAPEDQDMTLLQSLLMSKDMDVSSAMVMVADMLMAGVDTTSTSTGFFLYHLAKNPDKQEILFQEIKKNLPQKGDRITPSIYNEFRYLKSCLKESQRLNPVVSTQVRTTDHDIVFSGYRVPAGTTLIVGLQEIFMDEKYFADPDKFLPERWLKKDDKFNPYAYLPFGFGVRSCVGRRLAELELNCLAAQLVRHFKVEYHHEEIGMYSRLINLPDKPLKFKFIDR